MTRADRNVSVTSSYAAEGVTSGAVLRSDGSRLRCLSVFGHRNVSWYFPIVESLAYYGLKRRHHLVSRARRARAGRCAIAPAGPSGVIWRRASARVASVPAPTT